MTYLRDGLIVRNVSGVVELLDDAYNRRLPEGVRFGHIDGGVGCFGSALTFLVSKRGGRLELQAELPRSVH